MTTPDHESSPDLQGYLDEFGRRLRGADAGRAPATRQRLPLAPGWSVAAGVAGLVVAAVAVWAFVGIGPAGKRLDIVGEAQAALAPPGEIVHLVVTTSMEDSSGTKSTTLEQWWASDPPRWRVVQILPPAGSPNSTGTVMDAHGIIEGRQEFSYANGEQRIYYAQRDTLEINQGFADDGPAAQAPGPFGGPAGDLRTELASGHVTDEGEREVDGRRVRRLVSDTSSGRVTRRMIYDVDPDTFAPVQAEMQLGNGPPMTIHLHVDTFERLPLNDDTSKLLAIATGPDTKVTVHTAEEMRERERRAREGCEPLPDGSGERCPPPATDEAP